MLITHQINHVFGTKKQPVKALQNIDLHINKGELFGIIGPDGAGKTTLFRILTTLLLPSSGTATVNGLNTVKDYAAIRQIIGYMPGKFSLYPDLTVEENLQFFASLFGTNPATHYHLIKPIYEQIAPFAHRRAGQLSGGMKQKLALCCALIHQPEVLFLDEPTTGVDAVSRKEFWDMLINLQQQGLTIVVSTPYMDEAILCNRVALLQKGSIMQQNSPQNIMAAFPKTIWNCWAPDLPALKKLLEQWAETHTCYAFGETLHLTLKSEV
ncbi:MAG: ABC transporter ATP-binding protein, partial [Chitinophagaceae bacterium]